jgi:hypothetical protein
MVDPLAELTANVAVPGCRRGVKTMSEARTDAAQDTHAGQAGTSMINPLVLHRSKLPFTISLAAFVALLLLIFTPALVSVFTGKDARYVFDFAPGRPRLSCFWRCTCRT